MYLENQDFSPRCVSLYYNFTSLTNALSFTIVAVIICRENAFNNAILFYQHDSLKNSQTTLDRDDSVDRRPVYLLQMFKDLRFLELNSGRKVLLELRVFSQRRRSRGIVSILRASVITDAAEERERAAQLLPPELPKVWANELARRSANYCPP